jgi:hypothetical protein
MNWNVIWLPAAEEELADAWLNAPNRAAVTDAANVIDRALSLDPENVGESRPNGRRVTFAPPLSVVFRIRADETTVEVLHVWLYLPRSR